MKYVTFEVAKALKATGFNRPTNAYYRTLIVGKDYVFHETDKLHDYNNYQDSNREWFAAPTVQEAFTWLLKHNLKPEHNFNASHPELLFEDEIFLLNISSGENPNNFMPSKCSGTRVGKVAYDNRGEIVENMYPVFGKLKK